jgi:hypothetical protein
VVNVGLFCPPCSPSVPALCACRCCHLPHHWAWAGTPSGCLAALINTLGPPLLFLAAHLRNQHTGIGMQSINTPRHPPPLHLLPADALSYLTTRIQAEFQVEVGAPQPQRRAISALVKPLGPPGKHRKEVEQ